MKRMNIAFFTLVVCLLVGLSACSAILPTPTATPVPTATPLPTATPMPTPAPIAAVDAQRDLKVGDLERSYLLHVPPGMNDQQLVPLVFFFHGYSESGLQARLYVGLDRIANANGFIVVYPNGSGSSGGFSWNAAGCCGYALDNNVDDEAFVRAILADVNTIARVDPKRTYAAGFSNGGLLSYRLACTMSNVFAAVAPAGAVMMYSPCEPQETVSIVHIHGTKDPVVPIDGGGSGIQFPRVTDSLTAWAKLDGCSGAEKVEKNGIVTHTIYGTCTRGISVELYTLEGLSHTWPSQYIAPISQIVWDFFAAHPKP